MINWSEVILYLFKLCRNSHIFSPSRWEHHRPVFQQCPTSGVYVFLLSLSRLYIFTATSINACNYDDAHVCASQMPNLFCKISSSVKARFDIHRTASQLLFEMHVWKVNIVMQGKVKRLSLKRSSKLFEDTGVNAMIWFCVTSSRNIALSP